MVPLVGGEWGDVKTLALGVVSGMGAARTTTDLSYFSRCTDQADFGWAATVETHRRGTATAGVVCAVGDGAPWLQGFVDLQRPDAVRILDWCHASGYLASAAQAAFGPGATADAWFADTRTTLLDGESATVLTALQALLDAQPPPGTSAADDSNRTTITTSLSYLSARRDQITYAACRAAGFPIGSGAVESANKLVVEARPHVPACIGPAPMSARWWPCAR